MTEYRDLSELLVLGPKIRTRPLWAVQVNVGYSGTGKRPVVDKVPALTTLLKSDRLTEVKLPSESRMLYRPLLMQAQIAAKAQTLLWLSDGDRTVPVRVSELPDAKDSRSCWLKPDFAQWPDQVTEIRVPPMRLVEGGLRYGLRLENKLLADYLQLKSIGDSQWEVVGGLLIKSVKDSSKRECLPVRLTSTGIEFDIQLPDPSYDFKSPRDDSDTGMFGARVSLERPPDRAGFKLRLLLSQPVEAIEARLAAALTGLHGAGAPISMRFDTRPQVPSLSWFLEEKRIANRNCLQFRGTRNKKDTQPRWQTWQASLDAQAMDVRLVTPTRAGQLDATAEIALKQVLLERVTENSQDQLRLQLNSPELPKQQASAGPSLQPTVDLLFEKDTTTSRLESLDITVDLDSPLEPLTTAARAARALPPGQQLPFVFLPVVGGWLQLPVPKPPSDDGTPPRLGKADAEQDHKAITTADLELSGIPESDSGALSGRLIVAGHERRSIELESARHAALTVRWTLNGGAAWAAANLKAWHVSGRVSGLLFAALGSPGVEEALPTLANGSADTLDLPLQFGELRSNSGRCWSGRFDLSPADPNKELAEQWKLSLLQSRDEGKPRPLAWLRDARRPLISNAALTQTTLSSPLPSPSRQLLPMRLADASLTLEVSAKDQNIPALSFQQASWLDDSFKNFRDVADGNLPADADTLMSLVMPTLPGIEFLPNKPVHGRDLVLHASLRFDLPQLDLLFASMAVDQEQQAIESQAEAATALFPDRLRGIWRQQRLRLDLARTDAARASAWFTTDQSLGTARIEGLIEPYTWQAAFAVSSSVATGELAALPLGSYVLGGTQAKPRRYALDSALLHHHEDSLRFEILDKALQESDLDEAIPVTGFAAPLFASGKDWLQDSRGLRLKWKAHADERFSVRATDVVARKSGPREGFLLTTLAPIGLNLSLSLPFCNETIKLSLALHVRDLFVQLQGGAYRFENNKQEEGLATEQAMAPDVIAESLHEWRFYQRSSGDTSTKRYEIRFGALGFVPLRLRELVLSKDGEDAHVQRLVILGKIGLASLEEPGETQAFGADFAYSTGDLAELVIEPSGESYAGRLRTKKEKQIASTIDLEKPPTINLALEVKLPKGSRSADSRVTLTFGAGEAMLTASLFGSMRSVKGQVVMSSDKSRHSLRFQSGDMPTDVESAVQLEKVILDVVPESLGWAAAIVPVWNLRIGTRDLTLFETGERLTTAADSSIPILEQWWRWLGLAEQGSIPELHIDHGTGLIRLKLDSQGIGGTTAPIAGIVPAGTEWSLQGLVMASAIGSTGRPIHAEILGRAIDAKKKPLGLDLLLEATRHDQPALRIDWRYHDTSVVHWPLSLKVTERTDWHARTLRVEDPKRQLRHEVTFHLVGQAIPVDALRWDGNALHLHKPWRMFATTRHRLWQENEETKRTTEIRWQTLDQMAILSIHCLANPEHFSFAPRYRQGGYRGVDDASSIPHPGIVPSTLASAGFGDRHLLDVLRRIPASQAQALVVVGGAAAMFECQQGEVLATVVPWMLLPSDPSSAGTEPVHAKAGARAGHALSGLQSELRSERQWRIAAADAESCRPIRLGSVSSGTALRLGYTAEAITAVLDRATSTKDADWIADTVEQAFIEPVDGDSGALGSSEVLYFPRASLTLQAVWTARARPDETIAIKATAVIADETSRTIRVVVSAELQPDEARAATTLVALSVHRVEEVATALDSTKRSTAVAERVAYRDRGLRALPDAIGLTLRTRSKGGTHWEPIDLPPPLDDFGAPARELSPATTWPASPARSWPSGEGLGGLARLAPVLGEEMPIASCQAGMSARSLVVGWPAWAPAVARAEDAAAPSSAQPLYLSYEDHVVFLRGSNAAGFRGPAADHLAVRSPRPRAPLASEVDKALTALGATECAAILPPAVERSLIGARPGTFHASAIALTVPIPKGDALAFDPRHPRFGRPANSGPVVAHQLRFPRAPALPRVDKKDFAVARRTFVSLADQAKDDSLEHLHAYEGYVAVFRERQNERDWRFTLSTPTQPSSGWNGRLELRIDYRSADALTAAGQKPDDANRKFLKEIGLLPMPAIKLLIGSTTIELKHTKDSPTVGADRIDYSMGIDAERLAIVQFELARRPAGTPLMLALTLDPGQNPQRCSRLILLRLQPGAESSPQLPVKIGSAVFGDPAYDRQLGSATQSNSKVLPAGDRYLLSADRAEYDANSTVYFACIHLPSSDPPQPAATLTVTIQRLPRREPGAPAPASEPLLWEAKHQLGKAYAVPLNTMTSVSKTAVRWAAGDVLTIVASLSAGEVVRELEVRLRIAHAPVIAPPPAVYSLIGISADKRVSSVPLHACAPLPQVIEFSNLIGGLTKGYVTRRALFNWSWATSEELPHSVSLVKYDRSGSAQLPTLNTDFVELKSSSAKTAPTADEQTRHSTLTAPREHG